MKDKKHLKFVIYDNYGWPLHSSLFACMAKGAKKLGFKVIWQNPAGFYGVGCEIKDAAAVLVFGYQPKQRLIRDIYMANNIPVIFLENGFIHRGKYWQVGIDGICQFADFKNHNMPDDRLNRLGLAFPRLTWNPDGHILMIGQVPGDAQLDGVDPVEWLNSIVEDSKSERIIYRPHPAHPVVKGIDVEISQNEDLADDLKGAKCVVTFNSNVGHLALLEGIPVVASDQAMYKDVALENMVLLTEKNVYSKNKKRRAYFQDLAYAQWTIDEMMQGLPIQHLLKMKDEREKIKDESGQGEKNKIQNKKRRRGRPPKNA